ncbi:MAG TPA: YbhB/YbcL family Raf kinase inhibitor-like protein [bacterium]|nr:YbhB/YbcL family Raf kinase inhibitor-like protein [bacterium]
MIPKKHTCDGEDLSPPLDWEGAPAGTKAFALIVDDPDAPAGTWVHWVIYDIPGDAKGLDEGLAKTETTAGAKQGMSWGVDRFSKLGYSGPCPPPGTPHRYRFKLAALDAPLGLPHKATKFDVEKAMKGHVLGQAQLTGKYGR